MKSIDFKKRLLAHCLDVQASALRNARQAMDEAQEEANAYGTPKDRYDGFRNQQLRRRDLYGQQLEKAMQNIDLLKRVDMEKKYEQANFGSLVRTDSTTFLLAIGMGIVKFEGMDIAVVSMLVPISHAMQGKGVGEKFSFNNREYLIKEIV